jgi:hypothetical protein
VILAGASSIATSPRREHASWEVQSPEARATDVVLSASVPQAERGVAVQVTRAVVDHQHWTGGTVELSGTVRWVDPPSDPRTARLAIDFVPIGVDESYAVHKEIEIGRKASQPFELKQSISLEPCAKEAGCTVRYEIRYEWLQPRGGALEIAWGVDGSVGSRSVDSTTVPPDGASLTIVPIDPRAPAQRVETPAAASDDPNPFPASAPSPP